ncbi:MAG: hypothetical protein HYS98_01340, partial [Deltaproteobacteria bacterium]|nr:hypothetical protein [Deltaproteobacteria bacterium]
MLFRIFLFSLVLFFSGCGGDGGDGPAPASIPTTTSSIVATGSPTGGLSSTGTGGNIHIVPSSTGSGFTIVGPGTGSGSGVGSAILFSPTGTALPR